VLNLIFAVPAEASPDSKPPSEIPSAAAPDILKNSLRDSLWIISLSSGIIKS
jgi:hypothetical protein